MCGQALLDPQVLPAELVFVLPGTRQNTLHLDNSGSIYPVAFVLESPHAGIRLGGTETEIRQVVPAGEKAQISIQVLADRMPDRDPLGLMLEVSFPRTLLDPRNVHLRIGREPAFELHVESFPAAQLGQLAEAKGTIGQTAGIDTQLQQATINHPAMRIYGLEPGLGFRKGQEVPFRVTLDTNLLRGPGDIQGKLQLRFSPGGKTVETDVTANVADKPRLRLEMPAAGRPLPCELISDLMLILTNEGGGTVEIESFEFVDPPAWFTWTQPKELKPLAPGQSVKVACEVDAERLEPRSYEIKVVATQKDGLKIPGAFDLKLEPATTFEHFVAIDFGTTSSCVAYWDEGARSVRMVPLPGHQDGVIPSVAYFDSPSGSWLIGAEVSKRGKLGSAIRSVKRRLNEGSFEPDKRRVEVEGQSFEPEEVAAAIFRYLRRQTERHLRRKIEEVMITLPANFTDTGVQATIRAARQAGLRPFLDANPEAWSDFRLDEPTAAALEARHIWKKSKEEEYVLVFDFGGGTLDVSVLLAVERPNLREMRVLAHKGDNRLGGDDITFVLIRLLAEKFKEKTGVEPQWDRAILREHRGEMAEAERNEILANRHQLWELSEKTKIALSDERKPNVSVHIVLSKQGQRHKAEVEVAREELEALIQSQVRLALYVVDLAIKRAAKGPRPVQKSNLDRVIATGKTSLIPLIRRELEKHLGKKIENLGASFDLKHCVSQGACRYGRSRRWAAQEVPLQCKGINEYTNCSYGIVAGAGGGAGRPFFTEVIPEGTRYRGRNGHGDPMVRENSDLFAPLSTRFQIPVYQHTGDVEVESQLEITQDNRYVTAIDSIEVRGIPRPNPQNPPRVHVRMWVGKDGLLEADATVEGHVEKFKLQHRFRV